MTDISHRQKLRKWLQMYKRHELITIDVNVNKLTQSAQNHFHGKNMVRQELFKAVVVFCFLSLHFHVITGEILNTQPKISDLVVQIGYTRILESVSGTNQNLAKRIKILAQTKYGWPLTGPVQMFAENDICGSFHGQKSLYKILKKKFCEMNSLFVAQFVLELCKEKSKVLDLLVQTLFDVDRDGKISHYERRRFEIYSQFK